MTDEGFERENGGLTSMESIESRWVFQGEDDLDIDSGDRDTVDGDDDSTTCNGMELESDDEDNVEQKLIRTGPRIDSFDVEALEVPGVQKNDFEVSELSVISLIGIASSSPTNFQTITTIIMS